MIPLSLAHLNQIPSGTGTPVYDRAVLSPGILHIGVGNFHRAHMAVYLDRLFAQGLGHDWAIIGAGLRPADAAMRDRLAAQDWLTTVIDLDQDHASARVTGAMIDHCPVDPAAILERLCDPAIRILSLTVTEGGYFLDSSAAVMLDHPELQADIANPHAPATVFGLVVQALRRRRNAGHLPLTILSCDNLPGNGDTTRRVVTALAKAQDAGAQDAGMAEWISANVAFPNSMVDCITPRSGPRELELVRDRFGIADAAPVICEPFRQWVIEDHFPAGRPPLEQVGVEFVADVTTHEIMKLRLLNASHASLCYAAALMGYHYVHEAMRDEVLRGWLRGLAISDTIPTLAALPGVDYLAYLDTVLTRFSNPAVADTIARLAEDGSDRQPKFILPTLRDALERQGSIAGLALEVALWARFCAGPPFPISDPMADQLTAAARLGTDAFLALPQVFGDLAQDQQLRGAVAEAAQSIDRHGVKGALQHYLARLETAQTAPG